MKFEIYVRHKDGLGKQWTEGYDRLEITTDAQAETLGREWIESFNSSLRPGEKEREFIGAKVTGSSEPKVELDLLADDWDDDSSDLIMDDWDIDDMEPEEGSFDDE